MTNEARYGATNSDLGTVRHWHEDFFVCIALCPSQWQMYHCSICSCCGSDFWEVIKNVLAVESFLKLPCPQQRHAVFSINLKPETHLMMISKLLESHVMMKIFHPLFGDENTEPQSFYLHLCFSDRFILLKHTLLSHRWCTCSVLMNSACNPWQTCRWTLKLLSVCDIHFLDDITLAKTTLSELNEIIRVSCNYIITINYFGGTKIIQYQN